MDLQNSRVEFLRQVNLTQPTTAFTAFTLHDATANRTGQLWIASGNKMSWNGQEVPDLPTILGLLASKITAGQGLSALANNTTGAVVMSLDQAFQHSQLKFTGTAKALRNVTTNSIDQLVWGSDVLAIAAQVPINIVQTNQTANTANTSFSNTSISIASHTRGSSQAKLNFEYASGTTPHMIFAEVGAFCFYAPHASTTMSWLNGYGYALQAPAGGLNIVVGGSLTQNSDERLKEDIQDVDTAMCTQLVKAVSARTYRRKDIEQTKTRIGFVSQELLANLPSDGEFQNIVLGYPHKEEGGGETEYLGVDYARLTCVLWTVVKKQQQQIDDLIAKVNA